MIRLAPAFCFAALLAGMSPALAGGISAVSQIPAISGPAGRVAMPGNGSYVPFNTGVGAVSGAGINVSNSDGVTLQTNIDASRNVQGTSTVTLNETINGVQVGYGVGGDFLAGADAQGQAALADRRAYIQQLQNEIELVVQVWPGN
jgi:hypothetical protein